MTHRYDYYVDLSKLSNRLYRRVKPAKKDNQEKLTDYAPKDLKKKITYSQNWHAYNSGKTNQHIAFKKLLQELLFLSFPEDNSIKVGRKPYSLQERIFAICVKIYYKSDLRKCQSILKELKDWGYIDKVPCFKTIDNFFNDETISSAFDDLIYISSLPLAYVERTGAVDSSGFSTKKFESWNNHKWGKKTGKERIWMKAHISVWLCH